MRTVNLFWLLAAIFFSGCRSGETDGGKASRDKLVGQWRNVSMRLDMKTYRNSDSSQVFEVNAGEWEEKMNIRPIRTFFRADGTYNSVHLSLRDSIVYNPAGRWDFENDSLVMRDTFPEKGPPYKYKLNLNNDTATFTGIEDLDGDGKADDLYFGSQKRYSPSN